MCVYIYIYIQGNLIYIYPYICVYIYIYMHKIYPCIWTYIRYIRLSCIYIYIYIYIYVIDLICRLYNIFNNNLVYIYIYIHYIYIYTIYNIMSSTHRPHFTPGKEPVPILQEAGWIPGPVWMGRKSRPHRDSISDHPPCSQSV